MVKKVDNLDDLNKVIDSEGKVVVDFSAESWCVPCRKLWPHYQATAERMPNITFVKVDIDEAADVQTKYDIRSVPFVLAFENGRAVGTVKERTLIKLVPEIQSLYQS